MKVLKGEYQQHVGKRVVIRNSKSQFDTAQGSICGHVEKAQKFWVKLDTAYQGKEKLTDKTLVHIAHVQLA